MCFCDIYRYCRKEGWTLQYSESISPSNDIIVSSLCEQIRDGGYIYSTNISDPNIQPYLFTTNIQHFYTETIFYFTVNNIIH